MLRENKLEVVMPEKKVEDCDVSRFKTELAVKCVNDLTDVIGHGRVSIKLKTAFIDFFQKLPNKSLEHFSGLLAGIED